MSQFVNRKQELEFLNKKYKSHESELLIIYGRRRIGKTELLLKFCEDKKNLYFMGRLESREDTIKRFNHLLIEKFNDNILLNNSLSNWDAIFRYISEKSKERLVLVIDELPFLVEKFPEIISILQDMWDSCLKKTKIMLILSGSSVGIMEKYAIDYKSPLYGRRTGQWKVNQMNISTLKEFFPKYNSQELIETYAVIDMIPGYLNLFNPHKSFLDNLKEKFFSKGEFLYEEVEILLREELRDPSNYMSIISSIAGGLTSFNEITQKTNLDKSMLSKYLGVLESLGITERIMPITENFKNKLKSKKSLYMIKDNFFDFWFKFIYTNKQEIEKGNSNIIFSLKTELDRYISFKFESYCKELISNGLVDNFNKVGKWWYKDKEIDIVALNEEKKEILFAECKWSNLNYSETKKILENLKEKSKFVDWPRKKEYFCIIAKKIKDKQKLKKEGYLAFDLEDF
ncbi:MAG: ATP-binding protein [Nanoarchaeota archaeon]